MDTSLPDQLIAMQSRLAVSVAQCLGSYCLCVEFRWRAMRPRWTGYGRKQKRQ
jgi:hypothetical protein